MQCKADLKCTQTARSKCYQTSLTDEHVLQPEASAQSMHTDLQTKSVVFSHICDEVESCF